MLKLFIAIHELGTNVQDESGGHFKSVNVFIRYLANKIESYLAEDDFWLKLLNPVLT